MVLEITDADLNADGIESLHDAGLRVTGPRLATIIAVQENQHADVDTIVTAVRSRLGSVSRQAVYDVLAALTEAGIVRRVSPEGRGSRYEYDYHDNHHHLLCRECGSLVDVPCAVDYVPCMAPPGDTDLLIETAEVIYHGLCSACLKGQR